MNRKANWLWIVSIAAALVAGIVAGRLLGTRASGAGDCGHSFVSDVGKSQKETASVWICSMHPQVRQPKSGKCPICFMDLISVAGASDDGRDENIPELQLSPRAIKMAGIQTEPVRRRDVSVEIRLFGKVDFNESLIAYITAKMPGRVDKLYINYTGISVRKGDHMVEYFSPELMVAQQELLFALEDYRTRSNDESLSALATDKGWESVLKKFDAWGLTKENIDNIIRTGKVSRHMTLYTPVPGIVIHKNALEGQYFQTGDRLFTIADLSEVWVILETYETDLTWLRYGQEIEFTTESWPGEIFKGKISFISPTLDPRTRTVKVRVDAPNPTGKLKPEMFVSAVVHANVSQSGKVINPLLAGKRICPMHPSVVEDSAGKCHICGMQLVKAESLGYEPADEKNRTPLVIPATAPLITGKRAIVYLASKDNSGTYYGREIVLGPRAGNFYVVEKGLREGEQIVVSGNFKIDSALQILARPSMMSEAEPPVQTHESMDIPERGKTIVPSDIPRHFRDQLDVVYSAYFDIQNALAQDNLKAAQDVSEKLQAVVSEISCNMLASDNMATWHELKVETINSVQGISAAENLTQARESFSGLSADIYDLHRKFGTSGKSRIYRFFCPMAFNNKGGYWLQDKTGVSNPYFGETMLKCGEKIEELAK